MVCSLKMVFENLAIEMVPKWYKLVTLQTEAECTVRNALQCIISKGHPRGCLYRGTCSSLQYQVAQNVHGTVYETSFLSSKSSRENMVTVYRTEKSRESPVKSLGNIPYHTYMPYKKRNIICCVVVTTKCFTPRWVRLQSSPYHAHDRFDAVGNDPVPSVMVWLRR